MTNCPMPLTYPHLPDTFTGNKIGVEASEGFAVAALVNGVLVDGAFCEHPTNRQRTNSGRIFSQRIFIKAWLRIVPEICQHVLDKKSMDRQYGPVWIV